MSSKGILTNKQRWRRQSLAPRRRRHDFLYGDGISMSNSLWQTRSTSEKNVNYNSGASLSRGWATTGDLVDLNKYKKCRTRVCFDTTVKVVLIPTTQEYEEAELHEVLWFNNFDFKLFKEQAVLELKAYMSDHIGITSKEAIKCLYQASNDNDNYKYLEEKVDENNAEIAKTIIKELIVKESILLDIDMNFADFKPIQKKSHSFTSKETSKFDYVDKVDFINNKRESDHLGGLMKSRCDIDLMKDIHDMQITKFCSNVISDIDFGKSNMKKSQFIDKNAVDPIHPLALICS